jgi:hypothetical protein
MPNTSNPDRLSEFAKLYYILSDQDISAADATVLGLAWSELCVISVTPSSNINNYEIKDRCVGRVTGNSPGRESYTFDVEMNMFRQNPTFNIEAWNDAMDDGSIISFLILNDDKDDVNNGGEFWGVVGNFVRIDESEQQPNEGLITVSYTFGPAARSAYLPLKRRIYGPNA